MPLSPDNPGIIEAQFTSYLNRVVPNYHELGDERKRDIAWAFYSGVTAHNRAITTIADADQAAPMTQFLGQGLVEEVDTITERMWAGTLVPPTPGLGIVRALSPTVFQKAALLDEIEALCRSEVASMTVNAQSDYGATVRDKAANKGYAQGALRVAQGVMTRIARGFV